MNALLAIRKYAAYCEHSIWHASAIAIESAETGGHALTMLSQHNLEQSNLLGQVQLPSSAVFQMCFNKAMRQNFEQCGASLREFEEVASHVAPKRNKSDPQKEEGTGSLEDVKGKPRQGFFHELLEGSWVRETRNNIKSPNCYEYGGKHQGGN